MSPDQDELLQSFRKALRERPPAQEPNVVKRWGAVATAIAATVTVAAVGWQINIDVGRAVQRIDDLDKSVEKLGALPARVVRLEEQNQQADKNLQRIVGNDLKEIKTLLRSMDGRIRQLEVVSRERKRRR